MSVSAATSATWPATHLGQTQFKIDIERILKGDLMYTQRVVAYLSINGIGPKLAVILENGLKLEVLKILGEQGLDFNDLFTFACPDDFLRKIDQAAFEVISPFIALSKENAIRLWDRICQMNYINKWLYQLVFLSAPESESSFLRKNLNEAVYRGSADVLDFFLRNNKVEVTDEIAYHWWTKLRDHRIVQKLIEHTISPNVKNHAGEAPLLTVIKSDPNNYTGAFLQRSHVYLLLYAGATGIPQARALCEQLGRMDLCKAIREFDSL